MPSWHSLLNETKAKGSTHDIVRRDYLHRLHQLTKRNVIVYYSGWLDKPDTASVHVSDSDKNGFMTVIHGLDRTKGLDLFLHTPGGDTAATESLVTYLRKMFGTDIRAVVPQLAMSAGTMIACACKEILMGAHSSLGPIDPQFRGVPAHGIVEEFRRAHTEIKPDPSKVAVWQPIIAKYTPTLIGECEKAIQWSEEMAKDWLISGMLEGEDNAEQKAASIIKELGDHALTKSHARHLSAEKCKALGLNIVDLEDDQKQQEAMLSVHHACMITMGHTPAVKLIENHEGVAFIQTEHTVMMAQNRMADAI